MRAAISTDNNRVSMHFGRCPQFTIVDIEDGKEINREVIDNPGHSPGFLPEFLAGKKVDCIISGGMGQKARHLFSESNIEPVMGVSGSVESVIERIIKSTLKGGENICKPGGGKGYGVPKEK